MLLLTGAGSLSWQPVPTASLMLAPAFVQPFSHMGQGVGPDGN